MTDCAETDELAPQTAGGTWAFDVELTDGDAADDLGNTELWLTLLLDVTDPSSIKLQYKYTVPVSEDATKGLATLVVPSNVTAIDAGNYWLDLQRVRPGSPPDVWPFYRQRAFSVLPAVPRNP